MASLTEAEINYLSQTLSGETPKLQTTNAELRKSLKKQNIPTPEINNRVARYNWTRFRTFMKSHDLLRSEMKSKGNKGRG